MNSSIIFSTFLVVFREALEACLILGIILTVLARLGARRYFSHVFASSAVAIGLSYAAGLWLAGLTETSQETMGPIIEGCISLLAASVLTYMFFWMERQSRFLKPEIETKIETAFSRKDLFVIMSLPFFAVFREGAETVLFLKAVSIQSGGSVSWMGGFLGIGTALVITVFIFVGGKRVPLRPLFRSTGILILFVAAGLLAYGVHELNEIGWVPSVIEHVYNINPLLNEKGSMGSFLKALFGYNGNPSLTEMIAYWSYLAAMAWGIRRLSVPTPQKNNSSVTHLDESVKV